jgi:hypothetical protein
MTTTQQPPQQQNDEAAYWKQRYETERQRLAKLWVAYKALETESANAAAAAKQQPKS